MGIVIRNKARLVALGHIQEEGIDYDEVFAPVTRIEAIRLFLAYASFKDFVVYEMDVKSAFLSEKIEEEVYKKDDIFISQDKYVAEILKRFRFTKVKNESTPMETQKPLLKDKDGKEVDVHMYRYLKGRPKLGLWYPKDFPFDLVAYTDSDYTRVSLDMKSTIGGCQFLECRLISWQCKKQIVVANSTTEAEYVVASSITYYCWVNVKAVEEQFWYTTVAKTINRDAQIHARVDGKKVVIFEASIRRDLQNMRRIEKGFSKRTTPLFPTMVVQSQLDEGEVTSHTNVHAEKNNNDQAEKGEQLQDDKITNPICAPTQEKVESSSHNIGNTNVPTFNQPKVSKYRWTKAHPLEQVRRNPSRPMQTRQQLAIDPEMCMYALTVSPAEPKNIKEAMADSAWIEAMQEEPYQFVKLQKDEDQSVVDNKARLVAKGYALEEGMDFEESFAPVARLKVVRIFIAYAAHNRFEMSLMGEMKFFLGLQIHQSLSGIFINQAKHTLEILHKHGMDKGQSIDTPMATKPKLNADLSGNPVDQTDYRSKIRSLMYLTSSRPDMVQAVCFCVRYQSQPTKKHLKEVKRIFGYLRGTVHMGLWYPKDSSFELTAFLDVDHAGCIDSHKSTSGGIQFLGDKLVSWMTKKQNCTAISSAEAEYVVLSTSCAQVIIGSDPSVLTGIGDEIYSTVDACQTAQEMWEAIERLQQGESLNIQDVKTNLFWEFGKEIAKPITPPSETSSEEDSDPEQPQRDKDMQKNLALIAKYFKKIYKPTNNNLRTSSNLRNKNVDTTPWYKNDNQSGKFMNQRTMNLVGARENVGSLVVQQSGIQCFNCKEFRHFAKECRKLKRVKYSAYHKEKMLLCKQAEQATWQRSRRFLLLTQASILIQWNSNTCLVETDDSNVIPDSPDICEDAIQNDQNNVENDDERVALSILIANLKLDVDENKKIQKQLKKENTTLAQELKECKTILAETSKSLRESISVRDSCLVALQTKQAEFEKYKAFNDRTIDYDKLELKALNPRLLHYQTSYILPSPNKIHHPLIHKLSRLIVILVPWSRSLSSSEDVLDRGVIGLAISLPLCLVVV
nr:ribonuclease H-like domain-containing protein [Tanacetum cinerariifolium]